MFTNVYKCLSQQNMSSEEQMNLVVNELWREFKQFSSVRMNIYLINFNWLYFWFIIFLINYIFK